MKEDTLMFDDILETFASAVEKTVHSTSSDYSFGGYAGGTIGNYVGRTVAGPIGGLIGQEVGEAVGRKLDE